MATKKLVIEVDLDSSDFSRGIGRVKGDIDKAGKSAKGFSMSVASIATGFIAAKVAISAFTGSLRTLSSVIGGAVNNARDLEEANNKFNVTFGAVGDKARKVRDELVDAYGQSSIAATKLLSDTGDLLAGFGFTANQALDLSGKVNALAVDLASFSNIEGGATRASEILTKALLGERDALISLGVKVSEEEVKQRLVLEGKDKLTGAALRQARAEATFALIVAQSGNAIGDYARSQGSLAQAQRELDKNITNLSTNIGQAFLPVLGKVLELVNPLIESASKWAMENRAIIAGGVLKGFLFLADTIKVSGQAVEFVIKAFFNFRRNLATIQIFAIEVWQGLVVTARQAANLIVTGFQTMKVKILEIWNGLAEAAAAGARILGKDAAEAANKFSITAGRALNEAREEAGLYADSLLDVTENLPGEDAIRRLEATRDRMAENVSETAAWGDSFEKAITQLRAGIASVDVSEAGFAAREAATPGAGGAAGGPAGDVDAATLAGQLEGAKQEAMLLRQQEGQATRLEQETTFLNQVLEQYGLFNEGIVSFSEAASVTMTEFFLGAFSQVQGAVTDVVFGALTGAEDIGKAWKALGNNILKSMVGALVQIGTQALLSALFTNTLTSKQASAELAKASATTYANAFAATSAIPIVGPSLAPAAAQAAVAAMQGGAIASSAVGAGVGAATVPKLQSGADNIAAEVQPAVLHRGERVVQAEANRDLTTFLRKVNSEGVQGANININIDTFVGDDQFVDVLTERISDAIRFRNVLFEGSSA